LIANMNLWHPATSRKDEAKFKSFCRMEVWP